MEKTNRRVAVTKRMLKEGLLRLLEKKDIKKVSITELCDEAGVNRATFYRHYSVPEDLLTEIAVNIMEDMRRVCKSPRSKNEVRDYLVALFEHIYKNAAIIKILMRAGSDESLKFLLSRVYRDLINEEGRELDADSIKLVTTYFAGGGYLLVRCWLMENISKTPEEIADIVFGLFNETVILKELE